MDDIATAIRDRAAEVQRDYLGFLEWIAWGVIHSAAVYILVGANLVDTFALFAPELTPPPGNPPLIAAACISDGSGTLKAVGDYAALRRVNHWVEAVPVREVHATSVIDVEASAVLSSNVLSIVSYGAGFGIRRTRCDGHCAVDIMAKHQGKANTLGNMFAIRGELATFLRDRAADAVFQGVYANCEGYDPPLAGPAVAASPSKRQRRGYIGPATALSASTSAASGVDAACSQPPSPPPLPPPKLPPPPSTPPRATQGGLPTESASAVSSQPSTPQPTTERPVALLTPAKDALTDRLKERVPFCRWFADQPAKRKRDALVDYHSLKELQSEWRRCLPKAEKKQAALADRKRSRHAYKLRQRLLLGSEFLRWRATDGAKSLHFHVDFLRHHRQDDSAAICKADKEMLKRCISLATQSAAGGNVGEYGVRHYSSACLRKPAELKRRRGLQGRKATCPYIREALWDWFVDARFTAQCRITPKLAMLQARSIATEVVRHMRDEGIVMTLPFINKQWMLRWQRDYNVVFRKANSRPKCSYDHLKKNCRETWRSVYFARALAIECFGHDLPMFGLDQTPLYMNQSGSKDSKTLDARGAPITALKEAHAQTRGRISILTCTADSEDVADQEGGLPIEIMFKGKTKRTLKEAGAELRVPAVSNISLAYSIKGSYRAEHMVAFFDRSACFGWPHAVAAAVGVALPPNPVT